MSTEHTKGPWIHKLQALSRQVWSERGALIASVPNVSSLSHERRMANARLIAASPTMCNTLEAISCDAQSWLDGEMDSLTASDLMQAFISVAGKALAEAEGAL